MKKITKIFLITPLFMLPLLTGTRSQPDPYQIANETGGFFDPDTDLVELGYEDAFSEHGGGMAFVADEYNSVQLREDENIGKPVNTAIAAIFGIIAVVGLVANGVVFFVIFGGNEISKTVTAMYVVQLAVADSAFLLTLPIFGIDSITQNWSFGEFTCRFCQTLKFLNYQAGIFFLTAMSVDRYIAVTYSTKAHQLRTRKRTAIICAIVWAVAAIMSLPVMIYSQLEEVTGELKCRIMFPGYKPFADSDTYIDYGIVYDDSAFNYSSNDLIGLDFFVSTVPSAEEPVYYETCSHAVKSHQYRIWLVVSFVLSFVVPFSIITVSYVLILKRLRASEERIATMTGKRTQNMRRKVTRMVAVLVVCFVICWLPYHILQLCKIKGFQASVMICNVVEQFVVALAFANSAINPILYSFLGHNFGERLRESVNHTRRRLRRGSSATGVSGHQTRSHTEHAGHSLFPRRFSQLVGFRRGYRNSASGEGNPVQIDDNYHSEGRRVKFGIPLRDLNKKRERQYEKTENATAFTSNPTELTRVTVDKETPKKSSFSEADTV